MSRYELIIQIAVWLDIAAINIKKKFNFFKIKLKNSTSNTNGL